MAASQPAPAGALGLETRFVPLSWGELGPLTSTQAKGQVRESIGTWTNPCRSKKLAERESWSSTWWWQPAIRLLVAMVKAYHPHILQACNERTSSVTLNVMKLLSTHSPAKGPDSPHVLAWLMGSDLSYCRISNSLRAILPQMAYSMVCMHNASMISYKYDAIYGIS